MGKFKHPFDLMLDSTVDHYTETRKTYYLPDVLEQIDVHDHIKDTVRYFCL